MFRSKDHTTIPEKKIRFLIFFLLDVNIDPLYLTRLITDSFEMLFGSDNMRCYRNMFYLMKIHIRFKSYSPLSKI